MKKNSKILMRFFASGLMMLTLIFYSYSSYAQSSGLTLEEKMTSLKQVIEKVEKISGYNFLYNAQLVDVSKKVSISKKNVELRVILNELFKGTDITYRVVDKQVILSSKKGGADKISDSNESGGNSLNSRGDQKGSREIKGTVLDESGRPIPGATLMVKGTIIGTATTIDGFFTILVPQGKKNLVASFIGYTSVEFALTGSDTYQLMLKQDSKRIDEVVITGYQTLSKERATGAFAKVSCAELEKYSTTSLSQKLQTSMNGVKVKPNGKIEIRGLSTLSPQGGKTDPLIVVDGFPIEGGLSSINTNDVESITVLKDAAAASIYGIKSANGVIVVTTKSANNDKFTVDASADYSITAKPSLSYFNKMNASDAVDLQWEALGKDCFKTTFSNPYNPYSYLAQLYKEYKAGDVTALDRKKVLAGYGRLAEKQYEDYLMQRSTTGQYGVSISGGNKSSQYYVSGKIEDNDRMFKGNDDKKFFLDSRVKMNLTTNLSLNVGISANYGSSNGNASFGSNTFLSSVVPFEPLMIDGKLQPVNRQSLPFAYREKANQLGLLSAGIEYNPINELNSSNRQVENSYNRYQFGVNYTWNGLRFDGKYQYEAGNQTSTNLFSPNTFTQAYKINQYAVGNDISGMQYNIGKDKSSLDKTHNELTSHLLRAMLSYNKTFVLQQQVSVFGGFEVQTSESKSNHEAYSSYDPIVGLTFATTEDRALVNWMGQRQWYSTAENISFISSSTIQRGVSFFFNGAYSLLDKYNLTGSFRIDQSNFFGTDSKYRFKPMWSFGASWNLDKENFISSISWIDNLILRGTYGLTGMIDKSTSPYIIIEKTYDGYRGEYSDLVGAPNPNLKWEQTANFNVGLDYSLFSNRMKGSLDYYRKYTTDVIASAPSDPTNGFSTVTTNAAEISNRGIDFNVTTLNVDHLIKWSTMLNFSVNTNKIEKLYSSNNLDETVFMAGSGSSNAYIEGYAIDQVSSYNWAGLDNRGCAQVYDSNGAIIKGTDAKVLTKEDLVYSGVYEPPYFGNITNSISYKNLSLNVGVVYSGGNYLRTNNIGSYKYLSNFSNFYKDKWMIAGDEAKTNIPALTNDSKNFSDKYYNLSSSNLFDASNMRLKFVSLSYDMPSHIIKPLKLSSVVLRFQIENLGIIWRANKEGIDPDSHSVSGVRSTLPALKTYSFGVSVKI
jgi:TonB-linked SusC/RagA family outer membrane protein